MKLSIVENGKKRESAIDISRFASEIKKNSWKILLSGIITGAIAWPLMSLMPSKYVSTATVLLKAQPDNVTPFQKVEGYDSTRNGYYETQNALMQSRVVLEQAVRTMKLDQNPAFNGNDDGAAGKENEQQRIENALKTLNKNLTINSVRTTHLATVSYESTSPQLSADIANGVAESFISYSLGLKQEKTRQASEDTQHKLALLKEQMIQQKTALDNYLAKAGLLTFRGVDGFETEQMGIVTNRLANATERRVAAESLYNEVRSGSGNVISLPSISNHAQIQDLRIALIQANSELSQLEKTYGPQHDKVIQARARISAIQAQTAMTLREQQAGLRQNYEAALADEKNYQKQLDEQRANFQRLSMKRDGYNELKLALDKTEEMYKVIYQRTQELTLPGTYTDADAEIYDPAVPAARPVKPNKPLLMLMIVLLVMLFYVMYIMVKAATDRSVNTLSQMQKRLNLMPLGEIRRFKGVGGRGKIRDLMTSDPLNADIIHSIRTQIMLNSHPLQVIAVTSAEAGEGRSLLANLLANSFSFDQKTLLIDMDFFNNDGLSGELASPKAPGVAEVLRDEGDTDTVLVKVNDKLDFLPRGNTPVSALLLLSPERLKPLLDTLRSRYQRIIIDAAAVNQSQEVQLVSQVTDGLLFVLKAGQNRADTLAQAVDKVASDRCVVIGGVLNQVVDKNLESKEGLRSLNYHTHELMNNTGRA
ncbi:polysaccharide biosynthesis tyrosine autokinase [Leclercia adecarboxylata]|uniref:Polysaccharide biosynthesis tyrosine autokinase n=1 Tax=Leclercia adecarboxylata TaxID=83655 RepID=A0A9X4BCM7_9ENTR|nr:polysaccharide biosynthesis tyrosine autokinase [Leclercia adecarboxylata]MBD1402653.1 polysaccharide biosynthesis tyrosine autokinase [Leclercia adecarboxylata]MDC6622678.1 polysaccharide biosynthesis tyrosine autokinase [Leclercia adecarboxylata]MDC6633875.1 polysaccharide biosynthesis tyrosine autokinase [Leclercia adecarboxylata]MDC6637195.1 polysaccharide biosynthesis tyrosine autokinase [Leclercia adecarboxylata]MDC6648682.1 polysaccharide biosynthesis tyrosine autokinase [Leclercia a